jgi:hypothetical protein
MCLLSWQDIPVTAYTATLHSEIIISVCVTILKGKNNSVKRARVSVIVLNATVNNISVISWRSVLLMQETGVPRENHRPAVSHWQTLSHIVVSSTSRLKKNQYSSTTFFFRFLNKRAKSYPFRIISLAHVPVNVTDFSIGSIHFVRHFPQT